MADFSSSGWEGTGLPSMTLEAMDHGDSRVVGWMREAVTEGDRLNRADPSYDRMDLGMNYVVGNQLPVGDGATSRPGYLPNLTINESRRVTQAHVSALTDFGAVIAYKSLNPAYQLQADLLNKLTVAWWVRTMSDIALGDCVKYTLAAGTGDLVVDWNPYAYGAMGGDLTLSPRDARDTLPIRPAIHNRSLQAWDGLVLRESHTVNVMKGMYPEYANHFKPTSDSLLSTLMGRMKQVAARLLSPGADTLSGLNQAPMASKVRSGEIILYRTYLVDRTRNLTTKPIPMGRPGASWAYVVAPGDPLYPYKRCILSTPEKVLYDGPSPYWHGMYPVNRLMLWSVPWQFLGISLIGDLLPIQDAINAFSQDVVLGLQKWLNPAVQYNRGVVSESFMRTFDPRRPGQKVKLLQDAMREGFKILDGPPAQVLQLAMQMVATLLNKFDDLSGTPNLQELLQLRQLPGADTIQRYWEALTPELRQEGRQIEAFLRDVAEQAKVLRFQYEDQKRRVTTLGDAGVLLEDFDFDPEVMVPAMTATQPDGSPTPGYRPELDASLPRDQRAKAFHPSIVFTIAPNSILAMNATEKKMIALQNFRMGVLDFWTYHEVMETPNVGAPPPIPLPPLVPLTQDQMAQIAQALAQPNGMQMLSAAGFVIDPMSGQVLQVRAPLTITERLIAQSQLGLGIQAGPAAGNGPPGHAAGGGGGGGGRSGGGPGRPASGQAPPKMEAKSDGRTTVTESRHGSGS